MSFDLVDIVGGLMERFDKLIVELERIVDALERLVAVAEEPPPPSDD